jgi:hypothetical protein
MALLSIVGMRLGRPPGAGGKKLDTILDTNASALLVTRQDEAQLLLSKNAWKI